MTAQNRHQCTTHSQSDQNSLARLMFVSHQQNCIIFFITAENVGGSTGYCMWLVRV
jgi:hypothetical protein